VHDRIDPVVYQRTRRAGLVSGFDETHVGERAEPHVACAAIQPVSVNPGSCSTRPDLQIQTAAIMMQAGLGERTDLCFGELLDKSRHEISPLWVTHVPPRPYASR